MKNLKAAEIIEMLKQPSEEDLLRMQDYFHQTGTLPENHGYMIKRRMIRGATSPELIKSLHLSTTEHARQILFDVLGKRRIKTAVPILGKYLADPSPQIRSSVADALAKIGSPRSGSTLLKHFVENETDVEVLRMLAVALGAVRYQPAIPALIKALSSSDLSLRGSAAWSLGELQAEEALFILGEKLKLETAAYPAEQMQKAMHKIQAGIRPPVT
jgi:HEAT repeats/PBS lyase HEAT-like repeat